MEQPSKRRATIRDVATAAGVSVGTVSQFLNGTKAVAPSTASRIRVAVDELRYIPNAGVRVMRGERNKSIAFLVPDLLNPFIAEVSRGIEDVALDHGLVVVACNTDGDPAREASFANVLAEMRVTGAIAMSMNAGEEPLELLEESGAQVVLIGSSSARYAAVGQDNALGGRLVIEHLLGRGHRRFVFFGGPGAARQIDERFGAAASTLATSAPDATWHRYDASGNDNRARLAAAHWILDNFSEEPVAVFCANDLLALALESAALRRSLRIPADIAIVGYDDIEGAESAVIPLTTVSQSGRELGRRAAQLALRTDVEKAPPLLPRLIARSTT